MEIRCVMDVHEPWHNNFLFHSLALSLSLCKLCDVGYTHGHKHLYVTRLQLEDLTGASMNWQPQQGKPACTRPVLGKATDLASPVSPSESSCSRESYMFWHTTSRASQVLFPLKSSTKPKLPAVPGPRWSWSTK